MGLAKGEILYIPAKPLPAQSTHWLHGNIQGCGTRMWIVWVMQVSKLSSCVSATFSRPLLPKKTLNNLLQPWLHCSMSARTFLSTTSAFPSLFLSFPSYPLFQEQPVHCGCRRGGAEAFVHGPLSSAHARSIREAGERCKSERENMRHQERYLLNGFTACKAKFVLQYRLWRVRSLLGNLRIDRRTQEDIDIQTSERNSFIPPFNKRYQISVFCHSFPAVLHDSVMQLLAQTSHTTPDTRILTNGCWGKRISVSRGPI